MSKLNSNYELISNKASNPVTTTPYIKHGEKWLDEMLNESDGRIDSVESGVAANTEAISQNTTNISTNTTNISGLDTRVTALEQGGGGGGGDNVGRIDRTEGATQHGEIFNMYTNDGDNKANRATGYMSHAEGVSTQASGACSHAEGSSTTASGSCSHAEGASTTAFGSYSHAEGFNTQATASGSHAEGNGARAFKEAAHAEGVQTTADGLYAHAEGNYTTASAEAAHAEGKNSIASGLYSHAEGEYTYAEEWGAHSEGKNTTASGKYSHAENSYSEALGENSHAEGNYTISSGYRTHTEGFHTKASGDNAHAEGYYTKASSNNQHVSGTANIEDKANKYAVIVGNGLWEGNESNAYTLDWQGNAWYAGDVTGNKDGEEYKLSDMKDKYTFPEGGIPASDLAEGVLPTVTDEYNPEGTAAVSGKAVAAAISAIPTPMQFKGTLGTGGTKTSLPTAEASNEGHTYRVITTGTYASQAAKVGDVFVSNGSAWIHIPAGDDAANSIVMTNYTSDKSSAGTSAIANTDTVTKAIGKVDNRLGNAETEIEKKVNKTSVSSGENSTTSVINVTDAKAQMAMIASIKGKTYKRNLYDINAVIPSTSTFTNSGTYISNAVTDTRDAFMMFVICGTQRTRVIKEDLITVGRHSFSFTAAENYDRIEIRHNGTSKDLGYVVSANLVSGKTYTLSMNVTGNNPKVVGGLKISEIQLEEGSVANPYVPFGLISTPVESVVSQSKNLADCRENTIGYYAPSYVADATKIMSGAIPVEVGKTYKAGIYKTDGTFVNKLVYETFSTDNKLDSAIRYSITTDTITIASGEKYLRVRTYNTEENLIKSGNYVIVCVEGTNLTFSPYNKTTVLVPSSVKNLPDYGCSVGDIANEIDFENGVYYHRVAKSVPLNWQLTSGYFFTSTLTNKKNGDSNFIHPLLSIGGLNVGAAEIPSGCARGNTSSYNIYARDTSITTAAAFNEKYGVPVIYELATTEVIPLADYLRPLPVEVGGTITLVNPYNLDVNSTIKYKKEVN